MQGNVDKLTKDYRKQMDGLFKKHEEAMHHAQQQFENAVNSASNQFKNLIEGAGISEEPTAKEKDPPLAVWSKTPDGKDALILNFEAAVMQIALLDRLAEVLDELKKLAPKGNVKQQ